MPILILSAIVILILVIGAIGAVVWLLLRRNKAKPLQQEQPPIDDTTAQKVQKERERERKAQKLQKGKDGEEAIYKLLCEFFDESMIFRNVYLEPENLYSPEIDLLAIHSTGIYVFESKNWVGQISGTEKSEKWKQTIGSTKKTYDNPVTKNNERIEAFYDIMRSKSKSYKGNDPYDWLSKHFYSFVVFGKNTESASIVCDRENTFVLMLKDLPPTIRRLTENPNPPIQDFSLPFLQKVVAQLKDQRSNPSLYTP